MNNPLHHLKRKRRREAVTSNTSRMISHHKAPAQTTSHNTGQPASQTNNEGIIRPQTGKLQLPSELYNSDADVSDERINVVVVVVVMAALLFIGLIAWLIASQ